MKLAVSGVAAAGLLALPFVFGDAESGSGRVSKTPDRQETLSSYRLTVPGGDDTCTVAKGEMLGGSRAELEMAGNCTTLLPRLKEARYWKEGANGDVIFADADGRVIAEFYAADGVAYESVKPAAPPMALTAQ
ncbi:AprI/Inh family metalloprotease inhibitor [Nitratireductor sp. GCM10026969]|uniref:AprI/Inh family metalloprotease inhibitor n=1 Tax=Nitratireductor sp. GCM10026969 TaxID=3252645 RepID=UPI00360EDDA5